MPQPKVFSLIDKAIHDYNMLPDGARLLIGASGGKDSTLLVEYFAARLRRFSSAAPFSVTPLYVQSDFAPPFNAELKTLFTAWGTPLEQINVDVLARVKSGKKMNCWWCSTQRRGALLNYALEHGYTHLVLGHHLDDILETLLMNMLEKATLSTMPPVLQYDNYPLKVIRPLCYLPVSAIQAYAEEQGWQRVVCTCSYQDNSGRKAARRRLSLLTGDDDAVKMRLFRSLQHVQSQYLP